MNYADVVQQKLKNPDLEIKLQGVSAVRHLNKVRSLTSPEKERYFVELVLRDYKTPRLFENEKVAA